MSCSCAIKSIVSHKNRINKPKHYRQSLLEFNDEADIDVLEQSICDLDPEILALLLQDRTTEKNIIWACDEYVKHGAQYRAECQILPQHTKLIQPRTEKTKEEQKNRTRQKAEVFTPSWLCNEMNNNCDEEWFGRKNVFNEIHPDKSWTPTEKIDFKDKDWRAYVKTRYLEITCGEAPYLVSRYDTTTGEALPIERRIGVLDRKLRVIKENTSKKNWLKWALEAYKSTYGFEFQGDNLLIARENLLLTFRDYYRQRFPKQEPDEDMLKEVADIISWNIWQMDGLKDCVPFSKSETQLDLFGKHTERSSLQFCKIKNWDTNSIFTYQDLKGGL